MLADDIDETMSKDWADIQDKFAVEEPEAAPIGEPEHHVETVTEEEPAQQLEARTDDRPRDKDGKFVRPAKESKPADGKPADNQAARKTEAAPVQTQPDAAAQGAQRDVNRAPSTWKPAARAMWDKLSPEIRAEIHRREGDFQAGQAQLLPDATFGKTVREVVEPYRMLIESAGGTPERAISDMLRQAAVLRTGTEQQKYGTIASIAQFYGIDLRRFAPRPTHDAQGNPIPPPQREQPREFHDPRVDGLLQQLQGFNRQREQADEAARSATVDSWMNAQDAQGNPLRAYVGDVIQEMPALMQEIQRANPAMNHAQVLDAAYERATWANPGVRAVLLQQQQTTTDNQRRTDNQQRVRDARRGSSVNVARRASTPSAGHPGTIDETIRNTARELGLF